VLDTYSKAVAALAARVMRSVVSVRVRRPGPLPAPGHGEHQLVAGAGSAVTVADGGHLLTAAHVVDQARSVAVTDVAGAEWPARVAGVDPATDLALLDVPEAAGLPALAAGGEPLRAGQWVMAVGGPSGLDGVVTTGVLTARGRAVRAGSGRVVEDMLQSDALLSPGGSGGALVDAGGRLIGIHVSVSSSARGASFAVPATTALWVAGELRARGAIARPQLGFSAGLAPLPPAAAARLDLQAGGAVRVDSVAPDGPAAAGGILPGDLVVALDGQRVEGPGAFRRRLAERPPDAAVRLAVVRGNEMMRIELLLANGPALVRERDA
jgi:S1-C subfamily serine protease